MTYTDEMEALVDPFQPAATDSVQSARGRKNAVAAAALGRERGSRSNILNRAQFGDPPPRPVSLAKVAWLDRPDP